MSRARDEDVEERAIQLAQADSLEWVKRPRQPGMADTPAAATNEERDRYRKQAREEIDRDAGSASSHP